MTGETEDIGRRIAEKLPGRPVYADEVAALERLQGVEDIGKVGFAPDGGAGSGAAPLEGREHPPWIESVIPLGPEWFYIVSFDREGERWVLRASGKRRL
jgi:hypothetical protein